MSGLIVNNEITAGAQGFLSTDGTPANAFATFQVNPGGTAAQWIFEKGWFSGLEHFQLVYAASLPNIGDPEVLTLSNAPFAGPGTGIADATGLFLTQPQGSDPRYLVKFSVDKTGTHLRWYTNSSGTTHLPTQTLSFVKAAYVPTNESFYSADDHA